MYSQDFPGSSLYEGLPVVVLKELNENTVTAWKLQTWREKFAPYFTRRETAVKLTADYWWDKVSRKAAAF